MCSTTKIFHIGVFKNDIHVEGISQIFEGGVFENCGLIARKKVSSGILKMGSRKQYLDLCQKILFDSVAKISLGGGGGGFVFFSACKISLLGKGFLENVYCVVYDSKSW